MKNILFIAHGPLLPSIRTRGEELAKRLANHNNVYFLTYNVKYNGRVLHKLGYRFIEHFFSINFTKKENLNIISVPKSNVYSLINFKKREYSSFSLSFNKMIIHKIIKKYKIDLIISEDFNAYDLSEIKIPYIYDVVDIDPKGKLSKFIKKQVDNASATISITSHIKTILEKKNSYVIPNGADIDLIRNTKPLVIKNKKKIIGYIGNHDWWSGLDFLIDVFRILNKMRDDIQLWVIGDGNFISIAKDKIAKQRIENIKFIGKVPKEQIYAYYNTLDVGVLPFMKCELTDACSPLKIFEYTAAKKLILATNLKELKTLELSNLYLEKQDLNSWVNKLNELLNSKWNKKWDSEIESYSWNYLSTQVELIINTVIRNEKK